MKNLIDKLEILVFNQDKLDILQKMNNNKGIINFI